MVMECFEYRFSVNFEMGKKQEANESELFTFALSLGCWVGNSFCA